MSASSSGFSMIAPAWRFLTGSTLGRVALAVLILPAAAALMPRLAQSAEPAVVVPAPVVDETAPGTATTETAVLAGGCFWGVQGVFQHVKGVERVLSGYSGGAKETAEYETVSMGTTGHAESVEIHFNPAVVSYGRILQIYFSVAHNPTELNFQGPDQGTQYRSAIFVRDDQQRRIAESYITQLDQAAVFGHKIVTQVTPFQAFYAAEDYHQDYATRHPDNGYIAYNDLPKIENLKRLFPERYRTDPVLVMASGSVN
ncbi:MAG: peptide-methionine (S)-S-oxide reductase MsrA [Azospirillaceae bacterium]|nr:peptide-methionine (S)-S-oxide reductase MsrA [Azospirillaceae bacterium]